MLPLLQIRFSRTAACLDSPMCINMWHCCKQSTNFSRSSTLHQISFCLEMSELDTEKQNLLHEKGRQSPEVWVLHVPISGSRRVASAPSPPLPQIFPRRMNVNLLEKTPKCNGLCCVSCRTKEDVWVGVEQDQWLTETHIRLPLGKRMTVVSRGRGFVSTCLLLWFPPLILAFLDFSCGIGFVVLSHDPKVWNAG